MKLKTRFRYRALSALLAVLMVITMLPASIITYAVQSTADGGGEIPDVYVGWRPLEEEIKTGETGIVRLEAVLNTGGESTADGAEVKISLTKAEASALQQFRGSDGQLDYTTEELSGEGVPINIELREDGGVDICFSLSQESPALTFELTFKVYSKTSAPLSIDVSEEDIYVAVPQIDVADSAARVQKVGGSLLMQASFGWTAAALASSETAVIYGDAAPDFAFAVMADSQNKGEEGVIYTQIQTFDVALKLPYGIYLPEGDYSYSQSASQITADGVTVASITGLAETDKIRGIVRSDASTLEFQIVRTPEAFTKIEELSDLSCEILFSGSAFTLSGNELDKDNAVIALSAEMNAVSLAGEGFVSKESAKAEIPVYIYKESIAAPETSEAVSARSTDIPAQNSPSLQSAGALSVLAANAAETIRIDSYRESYSQTVFWVDNNNEAAIRPSGANYAPRLYFSIDNGEFRELTSENMASLGLSSMPAVSVSTRGVGSYTVSIGANSLPSRVTYIDSYGDETAHEIEWRFAPSQINGYSAVEVTEENISDYPSISSTGWYYILNTDFSFYLNLRWGRSGQRRA